MHGIKITNKTEQNLYPHVFYFDNGDFSIRKLISLLAYDVLQSNNLRMPIYNFFIPFFKRRTITSSTHRSLVIGYGAGGWSSVSFYLPAGQDIDLGFF